MSTSIINRHNLATTPLREQALSIIEAGLEAIDTTRAINRSISLDSDNNLIVAGQTFSLANKKRIQVIGFGKASCLAAMALEKILGSSLHSGVVIDVKKTSCELIYAFEGSHPKPTIANVNASAKIVELAQSVGPDDLVIVIVSGGGSALLCWPLSEYEQNIILYEKFLQAGGTIQELNLVRKHLSGLKGGGLAAMLHPATVIGLVFSDVPGGHISDIASGPTFYDESTVDEAKAILHKYNITDEFTLIETPKDQTLFQGVHNFSLVTNELALKAMTDRAKALGFTATIISPKMYDFAAPTLETFWQTTPPGGASVGGGEIRLVVSKSGGSGGRNLYLANEALSRIKDEDELFVSFASDGIDNCPAAGALVDYKTLAAAQALNLDVADYLSRFDSQALFEQTGDLIMTGPTGSNVADLMMYLRTQ